MIQVNSFLLIQITSACPSGKKMKVVAFVLIVLMTSLCLAAPRRALVSSGRNNVGEEGVAENTNKEKISRAGHPDGAIDNHHNIPRQYYNQWGSSSNGGGDDGDNNGDGSELNTNMQPLYGDMVQDSFSKYATTARYVSAALFNE
ncbi:hypothetical protein Pfo_030566 [Paulownia fortunei]|nr:hypothetical protein Pfo_030566 [Paulownia fortunei]